MLRVFSPVRVQSVLARLMGRAPASSVTASVSLLLDPDWYRERYPEVANSGMDPVDHFVTCGLAEGRDPNVLFDSQWYRETYPDVAAEGTPPVVHYVTSGVMELRDPGPRFSTRDYLAAHPWLAVAGLNPLAHRVLSGFVAPSPSPWLRPPGYGDSIVPKETADLVSETIRAFEAMEPDLASLTGERLQDFDVIPLSSPACERAWAEFYRSLATVPRRVVFVAGLNEQDSALSGLIRAAEATSALSDTLFVSTDEISSPAPNWLPRSVQWRAYSDLGEILDANDRAFLTTTVLHSLRPAAVMIVGSRAAWDSIARHGAALGAQTDLFGWLTSSVRAGAGLHQDLHAHFRTCLPFLRKLYVEDPRLIEVLTERYGLPETERAKLVTLRRPWNDQHPGAGSDSTHARPVDTAAGRLLWIGDPDEPARAALRGAFLGSNPEMTLDVRSDPFVCGASEREDPLAGYDCVLLTARLESAADVVLAAAAAGTALVHVGEGALGLGCGPSVLEAAALLTRNGLAGPIGDVSTDIARHVAGLFCAPRAMEDCSRRLHEYIERHHSWSPFLAALSRADGFLTNGHPTSAETAVD